MSNVTNAYLSLFDNRGNPYFLYIPSRSTPQINTSLLETNHSSFLQDNVKVSPLATGLFTTDLTDRDDVLIAVLSLLLLLVIEGIVSTLLLRTSNRTVSTFGFSVKHFVELARDFRFRSLFHTRSHRVNVKLLIFALVFLTSTFALEVLVLFLTAPSTRRVNNGKATIRLLQPITPEWLQVRFHSRASINRACTALSLAGVEQGRTSVSSCLTSDLTGGAEALIFEEVKGSVNVTIQSDLHRYGAEHKLTFGNETATYSARAYLALDDGQERLMSEAVDLAERNSEAVYHGHNLFIAYLFSSYVRATKDATITAERLNEILQEQSIGVGGPVEVLSRPGLKPVAVQTERYTTEFKNVPAAGDAVALHYAEAVFKAAIGISITNGDTSDLFMSDGRIRSEQAAVWGESARGLNWISLLFTLTGTLLVLVSMRFWFQPASTAEIAGMYVKGLVGANRARAPLQIAEGERRWFRIGGGNDPGYRFGAETDDRWKEEVDYEVGLQ